MSPSRRAFTLIELLVVITIIAILMALLLPAVQAIRQTANKVNCSNNLKQIGLALLAYAADVGTLPPGGITEGSCCGTKSSGNWAIAILPHLDEQNLFDKYDHEAKNEDSANGTVREAFLAVYTCPSDVETDHLDKPESGPGSGINYAPGSYRGMEGSVRRSSSDWWDGGYSQPDIDLPVEWKGALFSVGFWENLGPVRVSDIRDGTSNTFLVGEMHTSTRNRRRTFWAYSYTSYNKSSAVPESRQLLGDYDKCGAIGGINGYNTCKRGWGALHPNGMIQFVMCDGSVQTIRKEIDTQVWVGLSTIAGDEIAALPE